MISVICTFPRYIYGYPRNLPECIRGGIRVYRNGRILISGTKSGYIFLYVRFYSIGVLTHNNPGTFLIGSLETGF